MKRKRNYTVDLFRFFMILFIIALHTNPFVEYNAFVSYFPSQVLSRIGVPFFAAVAGYYFFENEKVEKYSKTLLRYFQKYTIWSIIYFIYTFVVREMGGEQLLRYIVKTYLFTGFYHLWYMLAIMYTILLIWIISKIPHAFECLYRISWLFLILGIAIFGYRNLFFRFSLVQHTLGLLDPNVNMQTQWLFSVVPFFMIGYGLRQKNSFITQIYQKCEILLPIIIVIYFVEVVVLQIFNLKHSTTLCLTTYPLIFVLMIFVLKHPDFGNAKIAGYASHIASFAYFSHILVVLIFQYIGLSETPIYFTTVTITIMLGAIIVKLNNPVLNKLI